NTNCLPFSWISWKPSSCTCDATMGADCTTRATEVPVLTSVEPCDERGGGGRGRVEQTRAVGFGARRRQVVRLPVRLAERGVGVSGLRAPQRNLQRVDRVVQPP